MNEKTIEITTQEYTQLLAAKIKLDTLRTVAVKKGAYDAGELACTLFRDEVTGE